MGERSLGTSVAAAVKKCLSEEKNRKEFEEWYLHEYGHPYQWKKESYESGVFRVLH